jgi:hypothetical protein
VTSTNTARQQLRGRPPAQIPHPQRQQAVLRRGALTLLVAGALVDGVALRALGLEDLRSGLGVPGGRFRERRHRRRRRTDARRYLSRRRR